jgi:dolichol-phosphate mannosyltransferase
MEQEHSFSRAQAHRWMRFNLVGIMGFLWQAATLSALVRWSGLPAALSVTIAVLVAVSHNFLWHERFTWRDRPRTERARRWLSFNISTGLISVISNVVVTMVVMRLTGLPVLGANFIAVASASLLNFVISDRLVFGTSVVAAPRLRLPRAGR